MKQFTAILCFALVAIVAAESGYKYSAPSLPIVPLAPRPPLYAPPQTFPLSSYNAPLLPEPQYGAPQPPAHVSHGSGFSQQSGFQSNFGSQNLGQQSGFQQQSNFGSQNLGQQNFGQNFQQYQPTAPQRQQIVTKDIYIHSAPEDQEETILGKDLADSAPIRKNYRIVFIKAPSQNIKLAANALKSAQSANEEKTVIYVLSKKPDLSEVQAQLSQVQGEQKTSKPEVYFIKYKTQEEAARAQQEIQAQYDVLGGSTHVSDEGYAPVTSVSSLRGDGPSAIPIAQYARNAQQGYSQQSYSSSSGSSGGVSTPSSSYLPVKAKK